MRLVKSEVDHSPKGVFLGMLVIALLGTALRLYGLGDRSVWADELWTVLACSQPTSGAMLSHLSIYPEPPVPLFYLLTRLSLGLGLDLPGKDFWLRLPTALAGILAIPLTFAVGRVLFGNRQALIAALLLAISAFHVHYSQEARNYALFMSLALLSILMFWKAMATGNWYWWLGFAVVSIASMYTHVFAIFVLVACGLFAVMASLGRDAEVLHGKGAAPSRKPPLLLPFALSGVAIAAAYSPMLPYIIKLWLSPVGAGEAGSSSVSLSLGFFAQLLADFCTARGIALFLFAGLFVLGLFFLARRARLQWWFSVLLFAIPFAGLLAIRPKHPFHTKYVIFMLPFFLLVLAEGIMGISVHINRAIHGSGHALWLRQIPIGAISLVVVWAAANGPLLQRWLTSEIEDWQGAAEYLQDHLMQGDLVICIDRRAEVGIGHYLDPEATGALLVRERAVVERVSDMADQHRRLWGVLWHSEPLGATTNDSVSVIHFQRVAVVRLDAQDAVMSQLEEFLQELIQIQPSARDRFWLHLESAQLYLRQKQGDQAQQELERALAVHPGGAGADESLAQRYAELGQVYQEAGALDDALACYRMAVELDPSRGFVHRLLADLYMAMDKPEQAIDAYEKAIQVDPGFAAKPWFHVSLGNAYRLAGKNDAAIAAYSQALALDQDNAQADKWLKELAR